MVKSFAYVRERWEGGFTTIRICLSLIVLTLLYTHSKAQVTPCHCTATVGSGNVNFSSLVWTGSGCPTAVSTSYAGNLCVNLANGANLIMDKDFSIAGGFGISNGGSSTFTLPEDIELTVGGNMGDDANNNVTFVIDGSLTVTGTIYGKNSNGFQGSGDVTAGGLNFFHEPTCSPCNINWDVDSCVPTSTPFCTIVMPVTLIFFDFTTGKDHVKLTWATATELNFEKFLIEKSLDGKTFTEIGSVRGAGFSQTRKDYSFIDNLPIIGRSYYRLKAQDIDGHVEYFEMVVVNFAGEPNVVVYPNPTKGDILSLATNFVPSASATVEVYDNLGLRLLQMGVSSSFTDLAFNHRLKPGSYLLKYTSQDFSKVLRFNVK